MRKRQIKKRMSGLDKYCVFSIAVLLLFTAIMAVVQTITGNTQDTLVTCFFATFGGELFACAMIKRLKLKKENNEE